MIRFHHGLQPLKFVMNKSFFLMIAALLLIAICYPFLAQKGFTQLPGDFVIHSKGLIVYLPLTTALLVSFIVVIVFHIFK